MRRRDAEHRGLRRALLAAGLAVAALWAVCRPSPPVDQRERPKASGPAPAVEPDRSESGATPSLSQPSSAGPELPSSESKAEATLPERTRPRWTQPIHSATGESPNTRAAGVARVRHRVRFRPGNVAWRPIYASIEWLDSGGIAAGAESDKAGVDRGGFGVVPLDTRTPDERELRLPLGLPRLESHRLDWEADEIEWIVVTARLPEPGVARLVFRTHEDELQRDQQSESGRGSPYPTENVVAVQARDTRDWQDLIFPVASHAGWSGTITAVRLDLVESRTQFAVDSLRALERESHAPPTRPGVYLASAEMELSMEIDVQGPATLRFSYGRDPAGPRTDEWVEFEVRVFARGAAPAAASGLRSSEDPSAHFAARVGPGELGWSEGFLDLAAPDPAGSGWTVILTTAGAAAPGEINARWADIRVE